MKHWMNWKRLLAFTTASAMALALFASCGDKKANDGTMENGNVRTVIEQGSEKELTAVRENLIKESEITGLGEIIKMELYENGVRTASDEYVQARDNKKIYWSDFYKRVVNYTDGYILDIPAEWDVDFSMSAARSTFTYEDELTVHVTDESDAIGFYGSSQAVMDTYFQYAADDNYLQKNRVRKISEDTFDNPDGSKTYVLKLELQDAPEDVQRFYTYVVFYTDRKITMQLYKAIDDRDFVDVYYTYFSIYNKGTAINTVAFPEGQNDSWNDETRELYNTIADSDKVMWGLVNGNIETDPLKLKYPMIEKQLDFKFPIVTSYTDQLTFDFPVEDAQKITDDGRIIQFTYHFDYAYGNTMGNVAPILDVYRGELDEELREFARGVVEYGQPMLFRLNNEMNSDWVPWGACNTLLDADIFVDTWIRMYNIFEEEGANDYLIWVWNPQGGATAPRARWNDTMLYFPGANYVDMLGVTGYNFGNEHLWTSFKDWYQGITDYYKPYFGDWAWIISEFGCSDSSELEEHEGRRAVWIKEMFDCFEQNMFPNIKAAVWFNANDYDASGNITHEISLGRDEASREAFKEGLDRTQ